LVREKGIHEDFDPSGRKKPNYVELVAKPEKFESSDYFGFKLSLRKTKRGR